MKQGGQRSSPSRTVEFFPITPPVLPQVASHPPVPSTSSELSRSFPSPPVLPSTCLPDPTNTILAAVSFCGLLALVPSPPSLCHPPNPLPITSLPLNHHPMQTCAKNAILKPNPKYGLTTIIPTISEPCIVA